MLIKRKRFAGMMLTYTSDHILSAGVYHLDTELGSFELKPTYLDEEIHGKTRYGVNIELPNKRYQCWYDAESDRIEFRRTLYDIPNKLSRKVKSAIRSALNTDREDYGGFIVGNAIDNSEASRALKVYSRIRFGNECWHEHICIWCHTLTDTNVGKCVCGGRINTINTRISTYPRSPAVGPKTIYIRKHEDKLIVVRRPMSNAKKTELGYGVNTSVMTIEPAEKVAARLAKDLAVDLMNLCNGISEAGIRLASDVYKHLLVYNSGNTYYPVNELFVSDDIRGNRSISRGGKRIHLHWAQKKRKELFEWAEDYAWRSFDN